MKHPTVATAPARSRSGGDRDTVWQGQAAPFETVFAKIARSAKSRKRVLGWINPPARSCVSNRAHTLSLPGLVTTTYSVYPLVDHVAARGTSGETTSGVPVIAGCATRSTWKLAN